MKSTNDLGGKIFFFKSDKSQNPRECFTQLLEVNSNFDNLKTLNLGNKKAYGITINNELLEWEYEKKKSKKHIPINTPQDKDKEKESTKNTSNTASKTHSKKNDFYYLLSKPSYRFHKMKIKTITLNKTMCLSLDINGNVLVWGQNKDGLLGLGYDVNSVEVPTILEGLVDIIDISLSDYHAVALNSSGIPFSWGLGKYGELALERSIYSPVPQQTNTENLYSRVFCSNLITCFLDFEGHFSYFGVIIKQLGGNSSTLTTKNLLNDQNMDSKNIFLEKEIEELEDQKFKEIVIGNGFIGLLGNTGTLFTLEYNDKLTMLYSKYYLYNIIVAKNEIFGLAKDNVKITENKNNLNDNNNNIINSINEEKIKTNYYLCRWNSKSSSENEVCSDIWTTTIWKFKDEFASTIDKCKLLDSNDNKNILLFLDMDEKYNNNLNTSVLNPNKKLLDISTNNDLSLLDSSANNITSVMENIMLFNSNKKKYPEKILDYEAEFDDSFNLKYKRTKAKSKSILKELHSIGTIRSRSMSKNLNKSYNISYQNSGFNLNKSNFAHFGNNNISAIGLNTSGYLNKKTVLIPNNNNYKKNGGNNLQNYNNLSNQFSHNKISNFNQNSKSSLSLNNNDISKDNNDLDNNNLSNINNISGNNLSTSINNFNSNNKNVKKEKDNDNVNIYEESIDVKEKELNKYRTEIDDIIANYKNKQNIKKNNLMNKYGLSKENNINYINKQNKSKENSTNKKENNNILNCINIEDDSPYKIDLKKRYEEENEQNSDIINSNIKENIQDKNNLYIKINQSSNKKNKINNNEIMRNLVHYFLINKVTNKKRFKNKQNKSENEIVFNNMRQETFQNEFNINNGDNNSFNIENPYNLFISNSEIIQKECLSEGNDILPKYEKDEDYVGNKNKDDLKTNNLFNSKNENNDYNNNEIFSSPAFNKGVQEQNRINDLINKENNNINKNINNEKYSINLRGNINNLKEDNINGKNHITNSNANNRFSFNNDILENLNQQKIVQINLNDNKKEKAKTNLITQNINNINLNYDLVGNDNEEKNLDLYKKMNQNKKKINAKNNNSIKNSYNISNKTSVQKNNEEIVTNPLNYNYKETKELRQNKQLKNNNIKKITKNASKEKINVNVKNEEPEDNENIKKIIPKNNNMKIYKSKGNNININNSKKLLINPKNQQNNINYNRTEPSNYNKNITDKNKNKITILSPEEVFKNQNQNNYSKEVINYSKTNEENDDYNKYMNMPIKLEDVQKKNNKNYKRQNFEDYNFDDYNDDNNIEINENKEGDLNNCDYKETEENELDYKNEENNRNKKINNNINNYRKIYQKENIYGFKYNDNNNKDMIQKHIKKNNNYNLEKIQANNLNIRNNNPNIFNKKKSNKIKITNSSLEFFCYVLNNFMKKKCYSMCVYEIANFQKKYEKNLALKLLFMVIKKRIIFYKIKFFHRYKKIYRYMVKYKMTNNMINKGFNQKKIQLYNNKANKK